MTQIRPMLAAQKYQEAGDLWSPKHEAIVQRQIQEDGFLIMQPKWDGMRALLYDGVARSRSWKPLANQALQKFTQAHPEFHGLDGEVFSGHEYSSLVFRDSMSGIRSGGGSGDITLVAFDVFLPSMTVFNYPARRSLLTSRMDIREDVAFDVVGPDYHVKIMMCPQILVNSLEEIYAEEAHLLALGYEGGILRRPTTGYKYGRSTALGGALVKVKRRDTIDAQVVGYEPWYENQNEATTSALGYTTRSAHKSGKVALPRLGALLCTLVSDPSVEFKVGVMRGLSHGDRDILWQERESLVGRYCELQMDKATGGYDAPRTPVWIRWRDSSEF